MLMLMAYDVSLGNIPFIAKICLRRQMTTYRHINLLCIYAALALHKFLVLCICVFLMFCCVILTILEFIYVFSLLLLFIIIMIVVIILYIYLYSFFVEI